jgi:uncharacterized protein YecE (DUF72 family)
VQDSLFDETPAAPAEPANKIVASDTRLRKTGAQVMAATPHADVVALSTAMPDTLRLGTSSWNYPGWTGVVWDRDYAESRLSKQGLAAYARHPLFRTVSLDRSFYRPLNVAQFAAYAAQTGNDFRFVVKAPSLVSDALVRDEDGRGMRSNPFFLDAREAITTCIEPVLQGLGEKLGAVVFQISPLPLAGLARMPEMIDRLHVMLRALPKLQERVPAAVVAIEVRDREWLTPAFVQALRDTGATYCMGLHAKMPRIAEQLPILRELWPGPLVCRWNLNPLHGAYGYESAQQQYEPYDKLMDPDIETRMALARVITGVTSAGHHAYVTLSNKAEGSAPLSVIELAKAVRALKEQQGSLQGAQR